jgi:putative flippase GtrA
VRKPETGERSFLVRAYHHSFARFALFGALGLAFDVSLLWLLVTTTPLANAVALTVAFVTTYLLNFFLNRRFSFGAKAHLGTQLARFAPQVGVDYVLTVSAVETFTRLGVALLAARILAGGTNAAFNYAMYRWWVFRPGHAAGPTRADVPPVSARSNSVSLVKPRANSGFPEKPAPRAKPTPHTKPATQTNVGVAKSDLRLPPALRLSPPPAAPDA